MVFLRDLKDRICCRNFRYTQSRYRESFLNKRFVTGTFNVDKKIYCFWTGDNPLSIDRKQSLDSLRHVFGEKLVLVTPENLPTYILEEYPLHDCYSYLSLVHKADYLRCYFMHHHGGGYTDIKAHDEDHGGWDQEFTRLSDSSSWIMGYREIGRKGAAKLDGPLGRDLLNNWPLLLGNCAYICKPGTPFTYEWYTELISRMDEYAPLLRQYPGNTLGNNEDYPIPWAGILGVIFHPLCLKYHQFLLYSQNISPDFSKRYR